MLWCFGVHDKLKIYFIRQASLNMKALNNVTWKICLPQYAIPYTRYVRFTVMWDVNHICLSWKSVDECYNILMHGQGLYILTQGLLWCIFLVWYFVIGSLVLAFFFCTFLAILLFHWGTVQKYMQIFLPIIMWKQKKTEYSVAPIYRGSRGPESAIAI